MGFFDTISGAGRAIFGGAIDILESPAGQSLLLAGAQRLTGLLPQQQLSPFFPTQRQFGQQALFGGAVPQQFFPQQRQPSTFFPPIQPLRFPTTPTPPGGGFMPFFPTQTTQFGGIGPGFQQAGLTQQLQRFLPDLPFIDVVPQGGGGTLGALTSPFIPTMAGARAQAFVSPNPATGRLTWFRPSGRPIIFSGDFAVCRKIDKLARRARRRRP